MEKFDNPFYRSPNLSFWVGREDGTQREQLRWHQLVSHADLAVRDDFTQAVVFIGFCCDEGVRRNQGRVGAKEGPEQLRKAMASLPVHFPDTRSLLDAGDIVCDDTDLEGAQRALADAVARIVRGGGFPVVLGGGHEVTYAHFSGLKQAQPTKRIGIINIDAHLDIREAVDGIGTSGTGFYQIAQDIAADQSQLHYLAIGIQDISNTAALLRYADSKGVKIVRADAIHPERLTELKDSVLKFAQEVDVVYLTVDLDAFAAPYAPGVSALAYDGIVPDRTFQELFSAIVNLPNLISMDIAELNPAYDQDNRTARLGASLLFKAMQF